MKCPGEVDGLELAIQRKCPNLARGNREPFLALLQPCHVVRGSPAAMSHLASFLDHKTVADISERTKGADDKV